MKKIDFRNVALSTLASFFAVAIIAFGATTISTSISTGGDLTVSGASTLTGNVGVGTTTPWGMLSVNPNGVSGAEFVVGSSTKTDFIITNGGYVGIGTTSPNNSIQVKDLITFDNTSYSTRLGYQAGNALLADGLQNTFVGYQAGLVATSSTRNSFLGYMAGYTNGVGGGNTLLGYKAGYSNVAGNYNIYVGESSGYFNNGSQNTFVGWNAGRNETTGANNVYLGYYAGGGGTGTSNNNVFLGYQTGYYNTTGSNNIILGYQAGDALTSGSNNIIIGYDIDNASNTLSNGLNIGNLIFGTGLNGSGTTLSSGNIGIATNTPASRFSVQGNFYTSGTGFFGGNIVSTSSIGIGTTTPSTEIAATGVATTTLYLNTSASGKGSCIAMKSPDGTIYAVYVQNGGTLIATEGSCK